MTRKKKILSFAGASLIGLYLLGSIPSPETPQQNVQKESISPAIEQSKEVTNPEMENVEVTLAPTATPTPTNTPFPTKRPTNTPRPTRIVYPTNTPIPLIENDPIAPIIDPGSSYTCNCAKTCPQMSSCAEAQYQLNVCGCGARDADNDGIACDTQCQ